MSQLYVAEVISEQRSIHENLRKAIESGSLLDIRTGEEWNEHLESRILRIDGYLVLDIFQQGGFHVVMPDNTVISASYSVGGKKFEFRTRLVGSSSSEVTCELPSAISRIERRNFYRVEPPRHPNFTVDLSVQGMPSGKLTCDAVNLSEGGVGCCLGDGIELKVGTVIENVSFVLPSGWEIKTSGTVRWATRATDSKGSNVCLCGIEFDSMSNRDQMRLTDFIFLMQRQDIRASKHLVSAEGSKQAVSRFRS